MSVRIITFEDGREPQIGEAVEIDGQIYYYSGRRRFSTQTLPSSAISYDSCETAVLSTGGTLESPTYPVQDYCQDTDMDVELDRMYINPYDEISVGDKVFFNGRGFIKTGNTGTATHVLTAMPTVVDYDASCILPQDDPHGRYTACGSSCDFTPSTQDDMSNIDGRWLHTRRTLQKSVYQADLSVSYIDNGSAVAVQEIATSSISDSLKEFFEPSTHMLRINTGSSSGDRSAMFVYADLDTTGIGVYTCVNVSFKYSHKSGGAGAGMSVGIVVRQGSNYFAQFLGTTGESEQTVVTKEKQLEIGMWLRLGGTGTTYYPNFNQPCDYGLIFANSAVNVQAYITDVKVCINHNNAAPCLVSSLPFADYPGAEKYATGAFNGELTTTNAGIGSYAAWSNNYWQTTGAIDQKLDTPQKVVRYRIYPVRISNRAKDPKSWEMQASNDGINYVVLDTRTNQSLTPNDWNTYTMNNQNEYLYYRLNITENNGDPTYVHVQELELYNCD